ncbi:MAG TPA: hypothetical protein VF297_13745 [Pyrinomonadaceae bacterium]
MPVIGRLDGQVDELIISPISRRHGEEGPPPTSENEEKPRPSDNHAPSQTPPTDESSANADELPVWLL